MALFFRDQEKRSIILDTIASMTDTEDVIAAKAVIRKKTAPTMIPNVPMASNTFGRETNIRPGPFPIPSMPEKTYTAGMIIIPANIATTVSKISIWLIDFIRFTSFLT